MSIFVDRLKEIMPTHHGAKKELAEGIDINQNIFYSILGKILGKIAPIKCKKRSPPGQTERAFSYTVKIFFSEIISAATAAALFLTLCHERPPFSQL